MIRKALAALFLMNLAVTGGQARAASTFTIIHNFTGLDGSTPFAASGGLSR